MLLSVLLPYSLAIQASVNAPFPAQTGYIAAKPIRVLINQGPVPGDLDCFSHYCGQYGGFIEQVMNSCNTSLNSININLPPSSADVKRIIEDCVCSSSENGQFDLVNQLWIRW
jgi:hypothetical protein